MRRACGLVAALVLAGAGTWLGHLDAQGRGTPALLTVVDAQTDAEACERVVAVTPKVHVDLWGNAWREDALRWEDVLVENRRAGEPPLVVEHGRRGPVEVGALVCGLKPGWTWVWTYRPDGTALTRTS